MEETKVARVRELLEMVFSSDAPNGTTRIVKRLSSVLAAASVLTARFTRTVIVTWD